MSNQYDSQIELMRGLNASLQERAVKIDEYIESQKGQIAPLQSLCEDLKKFNKTAENTVSALGGSPLTSLAASTKELSGLTKALSGQKAGLKSVGVLSSLAGSFKKLAGTAASVAALGFSSLIKGVVGMFKIMKVSIGALLDLGKGMISLVSALMGVISALYSKLIDMAHELMSGGSNAWAEAIRETKMHFGALNQDAPNAAIRMAKDMSAIPEAGLSVRRIFGSRGELLKEFMTDYVKKMEATFEIFAQEFADSSGALLGIAKGMGLGGEEMNTFAVAAITRGHPLGKELVDTHNAIWKVAKPFGISTKLISRDVAKAEKNVKNFGAATKESLVNAVVQSRILGIDFEKLDGLMGTFASIESSTEAGVKLFEAFEVEVDPYLLLGAQETGTMLDHLRDQFKKRGVDASKFNRANAGLLASVTGLSAETAKQAFSLQNAGKSIDEIQSRQDDGPNKTKSLGDALKELADSIEFKVLSGSMPKGGFLDMWLEGLYSQMFRNKYFRALLVDIGKSLKVFYHEGKRFFDSFMEAVPAARGIFDSLRVFFNPELFKVLIGKVYGSFNKLFKGINDGSYTFTNFMDDLKQAFSDHLESFNKIDNGNLSKHLYDAALLTSRILGKVFTEISRLFSVGIRFIAATIRGDKTALNLISKSWKDIKKTFKGTFKPVLEAVSLAVDSVGSAANSLISSYDYAMRERNLTGFTVEDLQDKTRSYFDKAVGLYNNAKATSAQFFKKLKEEFSFYIFVFVDKVIPAFVKYVNYLQWYSTILGLISIGEIVWRSVLSENGQGALRNLWKRFKGVFRGNTAKVLAAADDLARGGSAATSSAVSKVRSFSGGKVNLSEKFLKHSSDLFTGGVDKDFKAITENKKFKEILKGKSKGASKKLIEALGKFPGMSRNMTTNPAQMMQYIDSLAMGKNTTHFGNNLDDMLSILDDFAKTPGMNPKQIRIIERTASFFKLIDAGIIDDADIARHLSGEAKIGVLDDLDNLARNAADDSFIKPNLARRAKDFVKEGLKKLFSVKSGIRAAIAIGIAVGLYHAWPSISGYINFERAIPVAQIGLTLLSLSDSAIIARTLWKEGLKAGAKSVLKLGTKAGLVAVGGAFLSAGFFLASVGAEVLQIFGIRNGWTEALSFSGMIKGIANAGDAFYETFLTPEEREARHAKKREMAQALAKANPFSDGLEFLAEETKPLVSNVVEQFMMGELDSFSSFFKRKPGDKTKLVLWSEMSEFQSEIERLANEYVPIARYGQASHNLFIQRLKEVYDGAQQTALSQIKDRIDDLEVEDELYSHFSPLKQSANSWNTEKNNTSFALETLEYIEKQKASKDEFTKKVLLSDWAADNFDMIAVHFQKTIDLQEKIANYSYKDSIFKMLSSSFNILKGISVEKFMKFVDEASVQLIVLEATTNFETLQNKVYNLKRIFEYVDEIFSSDLSENWYSFKDQDSDKIGSIFYKIPSSNGMKRLAIQAMKDENFSNKNLKRKDRTPAQNEAALRLLYLRANLNYNLHSVADVMYKVKLRFSDNLKILFKLLTRDFSVNQSVFVFSDSLKSIFNSLKELKIEEPIVKEISKIEEQEMNQMSVEEILYSESAGFVVKDDTHRDYFYMSYHNEGDGSHFSTLKEGAEKIKSNDVFQMLSEKSKTVISMLTDFFTPVFDFVALMNRIKDSFENADLNPGSLPKEEKDKKFSFKNLDMGPIKILNTKLTELSEINLDAQTYPVLQFLNSFKPIIADTFLHSFSSAHEAFKIGKVLINNLSTLDKSLNEPSGGWTSIIHYVILKAIPTALSDIQSESEKIIKFLCFRDDAWEESNDKKDAFSRAVSKTITDVWRMKSLYFLTVYNGCVDNINTIFNGGLEDLNIKMVDIKLDEQEVVSVFSGKSIEKIQTFDKEINEPFGNTGETTIEGGERKYEVFSYGSQSSKLHIDFKITFMSDQTVTSLVNETLFHKNSIFQDRIKCIKEKLVIERGKHILPPCSAFSGGNWHSSMQLLRQLRANGNTADPRFELLYDLSKNPKPTTGAPPIGEVKIGL